MDTSDERFDALVLQLYRGVREIPFAQFQDYALRLIKPSLDFDTAIWGMGIQNGRGACISSIHLHALPQRILEDYAGEVQSQDFAAVRIAAQRGRTVRIPWNDPELANERHSALRIYRRKYGLTHQMSTSLPEPALSLNHFITLFRSNPTRPWTEASCQFKERLFPHLIEAYVQTRCLYMEPHNGAERGHAIADRTLLVTNITPVFKQLMLREWPDWVDWRMPPEVCAVWSDGASTHYKGSHVIIDMVPDQQLVHLTVRTRNASDALSARELAVARLFARGLEHKEIAKDVGVSPHTVRNQIKAVYLKLGVSNKTSLAACLEDLS